MYHFSTIGAFDSATLAYRRLRYWRNSVRNCFCLRYLPRSLVRTCTVGDWFIQQHWCRLEPTGFWLALYLMYVSRKTNKNQYERERERDRERERQRERERETETERDREREQKPVILYIQKGCDADRNNQMVLCESSKTDRDRSFLRIQHRQCT